MEILKGYVKIDIFYTFYESFLEFKYFVSSKLENVNDVNGKQRSLETKIQLLENAIQYLQNRNRDLKDESKSYLKVIEILTEGETIDTLWQTSTSKSAKSSIIKTCKNTKINSLPLCNFYEVLHIHENDCCK